MVSVAVDDEFVRREIELVALRHADAEEPQAGDRQEDIELVGHVEHRPAVAHRAQAPGGARSNGYVVEHRSPSLLRGGDAVRKPRRRTSVGEAKNRQRREEARRRLLELRDQLKLKRARLDAVPGVRVNGAERLAFERGLAPVVHEHRLQRRRIEGRWRTPEQRDARRRRIVGEPDARGERDVDADGRMRGDPRRSADAIVEAVTDEQRIGGVPGESPSRVLGRERAGLDAVARDAGPTVALERLLVKEAATLFEPLDQAIELGRAVKLFGIAVEGEWVRLPRGARYALRSAGSSGSRIPWKGSQRRVRT